MKSAKQNYITIGSDGTVLGKRKAARPISESTWLHCAHARRPLRFHGAERARCCRRGRLHTAARLATAPARRKAPGIDAG
ncbi:MAG: hypothetical protein ACLR3C_18615 [Eggerthella lenta]